MGVSHCLAGKVDVCAVTVRRLWPDSPKARLLAFALSNYFDQGCTSVSALSFFCVTLRRRLRQSVARASAVSTGTSVNNLVSSKGESGVFQLNSALLANRTAYYMRLIAYVDVHGHSSMAARIDCMDCQEWLLHVA